VLLHSAWDAVAGKSKETHAWEIVMFRPTLQLPLLDAAYLIQRSPVTSTRVLGQQSVTEVTQRKT
jgi:hypothetical protein